jgi:hypothetical protein
VVVRVDMMIALTGPMLASPIDMDDSCLIE